MKFSHDWMGDTHPDALRVFLKIHSQMPPERKLGQVAEMYYIRRQRIAKYSCG
jgi:hypothetical protein